MPRAEHRSDVDGCGHAKALDMTAPNDPAKSRDRRRDEGPPVGDGLQLRGDMPLEARIYLLEQPDTARQPVDDLSHRLKRSLGGHLPRRQIDR